jgi:uncharacterized membrane protein YoaK (UPF0700 family)
MEAEMRPLRAPGTLAVGLSFVGGFVDTFGFVALFSLFTVHITGNFVVIGAEVVHSGPGVVAKLLALPVFMGAVAAVCLMVRASEGAARPVLTPLLVLQTVLLAAFMAAGLVRAPFASADAWDAVITGMIGVAAMAVQNAAARLAFPTLVPTTVMTGNVTQVVIDAVDVLRPATPNAHTAARKTFKRFMAAILSFTAGAILGAVVYGRASYWGLLMPVAILTALIILEKRWPQPTTTWSKPERSKCILHIGSLP